MIAVALLLFVPMIATAGPYRDDLARCLVDSTSGDDRAALVRWMFAAMSAHPAVSSFVSIDEPKRDQANKRLAEIFARLVTVDCKEKTQKAISFEGPEALVGGFEVLGQAAATEIFGSPEVTRAMSGFEGYLKEMNIDKLLAPGAQPEATPPAQ
jgi:hypothetical protein